MHRVAPVALVRHSVGRKVARRSRKRETETERERKREERDTRWGRQKVTTAEMRARARARVTACVHTRRHSSRAGAAQGGGEAPRVSALPRAANEARREEDENFASRNSVAKYC